MKRSDFRSRLQKHSQSRSEDDEGFTPEQARQWLQEEIYGVAKGIQLRLQEATTFVSEYERGKLSEREAKDRLFQYEARWGDSPIPGVMFVQGVTDEQILKQMDDTLAHEERVRRLHREGEEQTQRPRRDRDAER